MAESAGLLLGSREALEQRGPVTVRTMPTRPIEEQLPGTSGLRKKTAVFMQPGERADRRAARQAAGPARYHGGGG